MPSGDGPNLAPVIHAPPTTDEGIRQRIKSVQDRIDELCQRWSIATQPSTAPASAPAPAEGAPAATARALVESLKAYLAELRKWQEVRKGIESLKSENAVAQLAADVKEWDELHRQLSHRATTQEARWVPAEELKKLEEMHEARAAVLTELRTRQIAREQQIAAIPRLLNEAEAQTAKTLEALKSFTGKLAERMDALKTEPEREQLLLRKRILESAHALELLRRASYPDLRILLELERQFDTDRIEHATVYMAALENYISRVREAQTRSELEYAREQVKRKDIPEYMRAYWRVALVAGEALAYFQGLPPPRTSLPREEFDQLIARLDRSTGYLSAFMESVDRRPGETILNAYRYLSENLPEDEALLSRLREELDTLRDRQRELTERRDRFMFQLYQSRTKFEELVRTLVGREQVAARQLQTRITGEIRPELEKRMTAILNEKAAAQKRLEDAVAALAAYTDLAARYRSKLYWTHLSVRGTSLLHRDRETLTNEWRQLQTWSGPEVDRLAAYRQTVLKELKGVKVENWVALGVLVLLTFWLSLRLRRRLTKWALARIALAREHAPVEDGADQGRPLSESNRTAVQLARLAGRTAPIVWPLLILYVSVRLMRLGANILAIVLVVTATLVLLRLGLAAIKAIFAPGEREVRILGCTDAAARYHAWWLRILLMLAALSIPLVLLMTLTGAFPELRRTVRDLSQLSLLVLSLLYLARRKMFVQGLCPLPGQTSQMRALSMAFPLLVAGVLALIALDVAGYSALMDYLLRGMVLTIVIMGAAKLLRDLLNLWTAEHPEKAAQETGTSAAAVTQGENIRPHPVLSTVIHLVRLLLFIGALVLVIPAWGISLTDLRVLLGYTLWTVGDQPVTPLRLVTAVVVVAAGVFISRGTRAFLKAQVFPQIRQMDRGAQAAVSTLLNYVFIGLAGYIALTILHLNLGALTVLLGTLGLGLGLGLQPLFVNFLSGLIILFERHMKVGDIIEMDKYGGEVTSISLRSTRVRSPDNIEVVVPNGDFINGRVVNWTLSNPKIRGDIQVGVAYGSDVQLVRKLLLDVAHRDENVLVDPLPEVWFMDFGESALTFKLVCWFANPGARWKFVSQIRFEIVKVFTENKIDIPFPQRTLWFRQDEALRVAMVEPGQPHEQSGDGLIIPERQGQPPLR